MESAIVWTMLSLLIVQAGLFIAAVSYRLSLSQGGHASSNHKSSIAGGLGFLVMSANGLLCSHFLIEGAQKTILVATAVGLLGVLLLWWGLTLRSAYLSQRS